MNIPSPQTRSPGRLLVLGGTGKTGRRVAVGLKERGIPVRIGSRGAVPPFDWSNEGNWDAFLQGVDSVYITYAPDLAMPGATDAIRALVRRSKSQGVRHLVLLSGRGETDRSRRRGRGATDAAADRCVDPRTWIGGRGVQRPGEVVVRRLIDAINRQDSEALRDVIHPDYVYRAPGEELHGIGGLEGLLSAYRQGFPDFEIVIDDVFGDEDRVAILFTFTGTHLGELMGVPPTGESVSVNEATP